ncbi:MAG: GtrA family protein [Gammaproteobacteria bacterium]
MIQPFKSKQFLLFLMTGGLAALVNFSSRIFYNQWLDFSFAIVVAYITGMITAFILAKIFVFTESQQPWHHSAIYFALINLFAIAQTWIISMGLAYYFFPKIHFHAYPNELAHAIGIAAPVFTSYLGHKYFSFR